MKVKIVTLLIFIFYTLNGIVFSLEISEEYFKPVYKIILKSYKTLVFGWTKNGLAIDDGKGKELILEIIDKDKYLKEAERILRDESKDPRDYVKLKKFETKQEGSKYWANIEVSFIYEVKDKNWRVPGVYLNCECNLVDSSIGLIMTCNKYSYVGGAHGDYTIVQYFISYDGKITCIYDNNIENFVAFDKSSLIKKVRDMYFKINKDNPSTECNYRLLLDTDGKNLYVVAKADDTYSRGCYLQFEFLNRVNIREKASPKSSLQNYILKPLSVKYLDK